MYRLAVALLIAARTLAATESPASAPSDSPPLELEGTLELAQVPSGPYADHLALDRQGRRLFTTPQAAHAVVVLDLGSGRVLRRLDGIDNPHAVFYREDRRRIFVTDGAGALLVFDGDSYRLRRRIALAPNADSVAYDAKTGLLYVTSGGEDAGPVASRVSIIDTAREAAAGEIVLGARSLEAMVVDPVRRRLYVNAPDDDAIVVIDLEHRAVIGHWPLRLAKRNEAFALDAERGLLYVGCNEGDVRGALVVVDAATGHELERLPLGSWVDSMHVDANRGRIYASTGVGAVFTFERGPDGRLRAMPPVDTAVMARTSLFDPTLDRLFVMVPHLGWTSAKVLVFKPQ